VSVVLAELALGGGAEPWERMGFATDGESVQIGAVRLRFSPSAPAGITGWTLSGASGGDIDGLSTAQGDPPPTAAAHPNGALRLDHVVVFTPDLERTFAALKEAGMELRRVRDAGTPENPVRQGFYRLGEVILEVVGDIEPDGPARFWGLVVIVDDLDALAERVGDDLGTPRDAVQPGRRIATVRDSAELDLPVAFMTLPPEKR
jgi:predicted RNA-binding protein with TRAM domain